MTDRRIAPCLVDMLDRIREASSLPALAELVIGGLAALPGVLASALIGFDHAGLPALWIGDARIAPDAIRACLTGGPDPHETLALATGGALRTTPIAGGRGIAGVIQLVATGERPGWTELARLGAQVSARLALLGIDAPLADHLAPPPLTDRQREIGWLIARGCTNAEIAHMLGCSPGTIKAQVSLLLARFEVSNRTELAAIAGALGGGPAPRTRCAIYVR